MSSPILKTDNIVDFYNKLIKCQVVKGGAFGGRKIQVGKNNNLVTMNQIVRHFEKLSRELTRLPKGSKYIIVDPKDVKDARDTLKEIRSLDKDLPSSERTKIEKILAPIAKRIGNIIDTIRHLGTRESALRREKRKYKKLAKDLES